MVTRNEGPAVLGQIGGDVDGNALGIGCWSRAEARGRARRRWPSMLVRLIRTLGRVLPATLWLGALSGYEATRWQVYAPTGSVHCVVERGWTPTQVRQRCGPPAKTGTLPGGCAASS